MYKLENNKLYISNKNCDMFSELKAGLRVFDIHLHVEGVVEEFHDLHNVKIRYDESISEPQTYGSFGFYCLVPDCIVYYDGALIIL